MSQTLTLRVVGDHTMHCGGCERSVQFTLNRIPGVREVRADHKTQLIEISPESEQLDLETMKAELDWIGYQVEQV